MLWLSHSRKLSLLSEAGIKVALIAAAAVETVVVEVETVVVEVEAGAVAVAKTLVLVPNNQSCQARHQVRFR